MKKNFKKLTSLLLIVIVMGVVLAGCKSKTDNKDTTVPETSKQQSKSEVKESVKESEEVKEEPVQIKIYRPGFNKYGAQKVIDEIGKATNTIPIFLESGWDEYDQKIALMITTGDDVDWVNVESWQPYKTWGDNGLIQDLRPILEEHKDELPVLYALSFSDIFKAFRGDNGEVYAIPSLGMVQNHGLKMRKDWLDEVGMEAPTTLDGVYQALKAFKENSIGGPGAFPLAAGASSGFNNFGFAFYANGVEWKSMTYKKDGDKFIDQTLLEGTKEAVRWLRKVYQEGLINTDFPAMDNNHAADFFRTGKAGAIYDSNAYNEDLYQVNTEYSSIILDAPKGPTGIQSYGGNSPMWLLNTVPAKVKDPLRVLKLIEFMHSKEGRMLSCFGIEGVHYELTADGLIDINAGYEGRMEDFNNGEDCPLYWGYVSGMPIYFEIDKYDTFEEAFENAVFLKTVLKEPVDKDYWGMVEKINKYAKPYEYAAYNVESIKSVSVELNEIRTVFFMNAIMAKNFDFDAEWDAFIETYKAAGAAKGEELFAEFMAGK